MEWQNSDFLRQKIALRERLKPPPLTPEQKRASTIWLVGSSILVALIVFSINHSKHTVVLYPDFSNYVPFGWFVAFAVLIWLLMAIRLRCLGWNAIKKMLVFAVLLLPGAIMAPDILIESALEAKAFSQREPEIYRDNFRIYSFNEVHGKGSTSYYIDVYPYNIAGTFKIDKQDYDRVAASTGKNTGHPYCVSVKVEKVGMAIRALSPPREADSERKIVRCPTNGLRSEDRRYTVI